MEQNRLPNYQLNQEKSYSEYSMKKIFKFKSTMNDE